MIVKLSNDRYVNLANMTIAAPVPSGTGIYISWNYATGSEGDQGIYPAQDCFYGHDAEAIAIALDQADAARRREVRYANLHRD